MSSPSTGAAGPTPAQLTVLRAVAAGGPQPVTLARVAEVVGGHPNSARRHLTALVTAGHLDAAPLPQDGAGRRPTGYVLTHRGQAALGSAPSDAQHDLLDVLVGHLAAQGVSREQARDVGIEWGRRVARHHEVSIPEEAHEVLLAELDAQGFAPRRQGDVVVLGHCPLLTTVEQYGSVVCPVHEGMATGLVQALGSTDEVRIEPHVLPVHCRVDIRR